MLSKLPQGNWFRRGLPVWGLIACFVCGEAQAQKGSRRAPGEDKTLVTKSGINLKITYYPSGAESAENAPVAILLHGKGGNRLAWKNFAAMLQQQTEFAVITVDLSGHGESGKRGPKAAAGNSKKSEAETLKPAEYQAMVMDDVETVKRFIYDEHQKQKLNMSKLAIVGADVSASVAIAYADFDWQKKRFDDAPIPEQQTPRGEDVRALILLSPEEHAAGLTIPQSCARLKAIGMAVMVGVSKKDKLDKGNAKRVYDHLAPKKTGEGEKQYTFFVEYEGQLRGTDLLYQGSSDELLKQGGVDALTKQGKLKVETNMLAFLEKQVAPFPVEWRDRRSRLERDDDEDTGKKKKKN